ncbi:MAG TPA: hypothetical protein GX400_00495 [Chloroflexi bacterium]|nr:hypothetical protein [Chloroflexota bacterium]
MTSSIPAGSVSTYKSLAGHIDVVPRHVAYILATLDDTERALIPWHRVVSDGGAISTANKARAHDQVVRLTAEGVIPDQQRKIINFAQVFVEAGALDSGVELQRRL